MWLLESAKDQISRVDIPEQHVSPHVRYEMSYFLIRNTIGSVWEWHGIFAWDPHDARGDVGETLALQAGHVGETVTKHDILL
jgi:hypothetical protein